MCRLVAMTILSNKTREIVSLITTPWQSVEFIQLFLEYLRTAEKLNEPFCIMWSKEGGHPTCSFTILVVVVWEARVKIIHPTTVCQASSGKQCRRIENVLIIMDTLHQHIVAYGITKLTSQKRYCIVVIAVFLCLCHP